MRRSLTIWATLSLVAALLTSMVAGPTAMASPAAPAQSSTGWSGDGSAVLLDVQAPTPGIDVARVPLSPVSSSVDSERSPRATADAANLDASVLDALDLSTILTQAHQDAPPDNAEPAVDFTIEEIPLDPILNLGVSESRAHARWLESGACLPSGEPITTAYNETAGADVLNTGDITVASLITEDGGVSATQNSIWLTGDGPTRGLTSESFTQLAGVSLLDGTPLGLRVSITDVPTITATADGTPGGASTSHNLEDVVTITALDGSSLGPLEDLGTALNDLLVDQVLDELVGNALLPLVQELLTLLGDPVTISLAVGDDTVEETVAADGTSASITAAVLDLRIGVLDNLPDIPSLLQPAYELLLTILDGLGLGPISASVELGRMSAQVAVPTGGINCEFQNPFADLHKDSTVAEVAPGGQFDYTLTIPNHPQSPCNLTDVVVTDTITSPPGTQITAVPPADSVDGDTLTWNIGDLAINESRTITVTVQVPDDAPDGFVFNDVLTASGNCDGTPVDHTVELPTPTVTDNFTGPCSLGDSNKASSHLEVMPGQTFSYFVHVFNSGAEPCSGVDVGDKLDPQVSFVDATGDYTLSDDGTEVSWTGLSVPGGSGVTLAITVRAADDATGTLSNAAIMQSPDDPNGPTTVTVDGPEVTDRSVPAPPNPAVRDGGPSGPLPRTGMELPIALGAFALLAMAFFGVRRRMSTIA